MMPTEKRMKANGPAIGCNACAASAAVLMLVFPESWSTAALVRMIEYITSCENPIPTRMSRRASFISWWLTPRREPSVTRPRARISSTSELACQKNRYGEMVVPRIATMMPMKPDVSSTCGMTRGLDGLQQRGVRHDHRRDICEEDDRQVLEDPEDHLVRELVLQQEDDNRRSAGSAMPG